MTDTSEWIWATDEKVKQRAVFLQIIRSIVAEYGGTVDTIDFVNGYMDINVPEVSKVECSRRVGEVMEKYGC